MLLLAGEIAFVGEKEMEWGQRKVNDWSWVRNGAVRSRSDGSWRDFGEIQKKFLFGKAGAVVSSKDFSFLILNYV